MASIGPLIVVHGLANCDSVKKAQNWLKNRGMQFEFRDFKKSPPALDQIAIWWEKTGGRGLVNRKSTTWKSLTPDEQSEADLPAKARLLLAKYPTLIKRPVVEYGDKLLVGFVKEKDAAFFGG